MPTGFSPPARLKAPIRKVMRQLGYEIIPRHRSESEYLRRLLVAYNVDLVVDVGANQGQYASLLRFLGYNDVVHSFEPQAAAFKLLQRHAARDPNWHVHQLALGSEEGKASLHVSKNSVSSSLLHVTPQHLQAAPSSRISGHETVRLTTLDTFLPVATTAKKSALIKLDVQGFELDVLRGAQAWLTECAVVQCELSLQPLYEGQARYLDVIASLAEFDLQLRRVETAFEDPRTGETLQLDGYFTR